MKKLLQKLKWFQNLPEVSGLGALKTSMEHHYVRSMEVTKLTQEMRTAIEEGLEDVIETKHKEYVRLNDAQDASTFTTEWKALYNSIKHNHKDNSQLAAERIVT